MGSTSAPSGPSYMSYEGAITPAYIQLPDAPTRENYNFQGWTDVADSEEGKWTASQTVTFENTENTVYAAWKQGYYCTVCAGYYPAKHVSCYSCGTHYTWEYTKCTKSMTCNRNQENFIQWNKG